jgi:hypothetical protein
MLAGAARLSDVCLETLAAVEVATGSGVVRGVVVGCLTQQVRVRPRGRPSVRRQVDRPADQRYRLTRLWTGMTRPML